MFLIIYILIGIVVYNFIEAYKRSGRDRSVVNLEDDESIVPAIFWPVWFIVVVIVQLYKYFKGENFLQNWFIKLLKKK